MQLNRSTQGPYRCQNSKPYVNEKDSSNSKNADATDCTKFHHDHQSKHRTVLLTDWEDFNAGTDQSTFKGTLTPPNPPPLFNRKVSKQICEHFFHLRSVLFAVCQLIQYLVLLQSYVPVSLSSRLGVEGSFEEQWGCINKVRKEVVGYTCIAN